MVGYDKQKLFYDNQHGKMKKMYIIDFWFLKLHCTDLCKTSLEIFKNDEFMKNMKIAHFIGYFLAICGWIWQTKIILWQSAWKNEENVHLIFFILETLSQRFVLNILRDFWNASNYEKYQNFNFYKTFFEQIQLDMANEKIL